MPLPWKMAKNARICQLVNDHLHRSRKRRDGSSLFVETGFPTSLVDLFIKNREKLKKPSQKKRQTAPFHSPAISPLVTGSPSRSPSISPPVWVAAGSVDGLVERGVVYETPGVDASTVLMVVLKMLIVVVLALGTKRLTVGITIPAFLLFFLEYVGKHARAGLRPFSEAKFYLKSTVQCVLRLFGLKEDLVPKIEQERTLKNVKAVECEIQPVNEIIQDQVLCYQTGHRETEPVEVFVIGEEGSSLLKRKSRRAKIKSKMKKLVPKKLRCPRKEQSSKMVEIVGEEEDNSILVCDEYEEDESSEDLSCGSSWRHKEEDDYNKAPTSGELSESVTRREGKREGVKNWGYIVLCMIVLAGLIGGRAFAVILTLSWFLMLKLGNRLHIYAVKVPIIVKSL